MIEKIKFFVFGDRVRYKNTRENPWEFCQRTGISVDVYHKRTRINPYEWA